MAPRPVPILGRGIKKALAAAPPPPPARTFASFDTARQPDVKELCPLCCEELDDTEKTFYPCPCGYQVCLFCYGEVKDKCNALCPGCRREYGEPVEAPIVRRNSDERAADARLGSMQRTAANGGGQSLSSLSSSSNMTSLPSAAISRTNNTVSAAIAAKLSAVQLRKDAGGQPPSYSSKRDEQLAALPTGATWAATGLVVSRHQSGDIERPPGLPQQHGTAAVDDSAWPSLADSTALAPTLIRSLHRHDNSQSYQSMEGEATSGYRSHRGGRSMSPSSGSVDGLPSPSNSSQDLNQDQQRHPQVPHHLVESFASAQVSSTVHGVRHSINVPLPVNGAGVPPYSGAAPLKASMQQAVHSGAMCSREAAARLVALLRNKDSDGLGQNGGQASGSTTASRRAPPGFSLGTLPIPQQPPTSSIGPTNMDPSVSGPPLGRYQPIQPPIQSYGNVQYSSMQYGGIASMAGRAPGHGVFGNNSAVGTSAQGGLSGVGTYSMWSGLPGIELGALGGNQYGWQGLGLQQGGGLGGGILHSSQTSLIENTSLTMGGGGLPPSISKTPPPGFGLRPGPGAPTAAIGLGQLQQHEHPSSGGYNPLQSQLAGLSRPPPPGMTAYRPQLGAGL